MRVGVNHGIEDDQQLAHASREDDLGRLASLSKAVCKGFEDGVFAGGYQGGHIENFANLMASTVYGTLTPIATTISVERGDANKSSDFLSVQFAKLGDFCNEGCGSIWTNSWNALQKIGLALPFLVGFEEVNQLAVDRLELFCEECEDSLDASANTEGTGLGETIRLSGLEIAKLAATTDQKIKFDLFCRQFLDRPGADIMRISGDGGCVEAIGLGEDSNRLGVVSDGAGIDC